MRCHLTIALPNDILLELLRGARANKVTMEELLLDMMEDYLEDCRKTPGSSTFAEGPPEPGTGPKTT